MSHQTKVKIVVTVGVLAATISSVAIVVWPDHFVTLHVGSIGLTAATNLIWVWE